MEEKTRHQLGKEHTTEKSELLCGYEKFRFNGEDLGLNVMDYWQFQFSNLIDYLGSVAEFLVAKALSKDDPDNANGWTLFDIGYRGKRIEVKATSYYQSWKESHIISEHRVFSIRKTHVDYQNSKSDMARQNDVYIFCLETEKPPKGESANPLNLENWTFYVVPTIVINDLFGDQKTLSLNRLKQIEKYGVAMSYDRIKENVDKIIDDMNSRFTDIEGSVITKKDGTQWEFRDGKMVQIK